MSETYTFSIRLTHEDQRLLHALCAHYGRSRPDSVRQAMREILAQPRLLQLTCGRFTPVPLDRAAPLLIRVRGKGRDHG